MSPAISVPTGLRYNLESEDSPYTSTIDKLQRMQYLEFASKVQ